MNILLQFLLVSAVQGKKKKKKKLQIRLDFEDNLEIIFLSLQQKHML